VLTSFLRSFLLTTILSFSVPILSIVAVLGCIWSIAYIPGFQTIGRAAADWLWQFPMALGEGCAVSGFVTIGLACAFVGGLFDIYAFFYRVQMPKGH
jgi:hypothetical protein